MKRPVSLLFLPLVWLGASACTDREPTPPLTNDAALLAAEVDVSNANNIGPSPMRPPVAIGVNVIASGLTSPLQLVQPNRIFIRFVVDQVGLIRMLGPGGQLLPQPFLDLQSRITPLQASYDERGLLGLAFHPNFWQNGRFFVFYTAPLRVGGPAGYDHTNVISEFHADVSGQPSETAVPMADPGSERVILQVDHPQSNHNGGTVAFGPDGYLYISIGDGGNRDDVGLGHVEDWYQANAGGNGQDISANLLGNILRIDVNGNPYAIPTDNPFVGTTGRDEIYAYGFRNPYRISFDMGGRGILLAQDAGQELWEEVSNVRKGGNYAWNVKEGTHCFDTEAPTSVPATCPTVDPTNGRALRNPVIEFANAKNPFVTGLALTVVGGHVYRGSKLSNLHGAYIFGGAVTSMADPGGRLFVAFPADQPLWPMAELLINGQTKLGHVVKGFGQDLKGEVYVLGSTILGPAGNTGKVFKIVPPAGG